jgi:hypothetical protein
MISPLAARLIAAPTLLAAGAVSLPVSAMFLDGQGTENWILPAQFGATAGVGAGLGAVMPSIAGAGATRGRGAVVGALAGVGAAFAADVAWFALLAG